MTWSCEGGLVRSGLSGGGGGNALEDFFEIVKSCDEMDVRDAQGSVVTEGGATADEHGGFGGEELAQSGDFDGDLRIVAGIDGAEGDGACLARGGSGGDFFGGE